MAADEERAIARLTSALRTLEERRAARGEVPTHVVFFLGALDRRLSDEERCYVAMVFAARRDARERMTAMLGDALGIGRGAAIAGIRAHLEATSAHDSEAPEGGRAAFDRLAHIRAHALRKAAAVDDR